MMISGSPYKYQVGKIDRRIGEDAPRTLTSVTLAEISIGAVGENLIKSHT
jgi:hypothetical protein